MIRRFCQDCRRRVRSRTGADICRSCFRTRNYGRSRPILGRKRVHHIHVKKAKAAPTPPKQKKGRADA